MEKGVKIALFIIGIAYSFSLGLWTARGVALYQNHQNLKLQIRVLNSISQNHKNNLLALSDKLKVKGSEYHSLAAHITAMAQITPTYTLENAMVKVQEQDRLDPFQDNMLKFIVQTIPEYPPEETLNFQELSEALKKQRMMVKEALVLP